MNPMLCRLPAYFGPGLPNPTKSCIARPSSVSTLSYAAPAPKSTQGKEKRGKPGLSASQFPWIESRGLLFAALVLVADSRHFIRIGLFILVLVGLEGRRCRDVGDHEVTVDGRL